MKTSKTILLMAALIILAAFISFLLIMKNHVKEVHLKAEKVHLYRIVSTGDFQKLDLSSNLMVKVRVGKTCKVEMSSGQTLKPTLSVSEGTLHVVTDSIRTNTGRDTVFVRIVMPVVKEISACGNTEINLAGFEQDSLCVSLADSSSFKGSNNKLKYVSYRASGRNRFDINTMFP
jgi:hypothetical protein